MLFFAYLFSMVLSAHAPSFDVVQKPAMHNAETGGAPMETGGAPMRVTHLVGGVR
jgi:hypothetical protein